MHRAGMGQAGRRRYVERVLDRPAEMGRSRDSSGRVEREPSELFEYLTDIVDYQIRGGRIRAGETLVRDENEKIMTS
ncbi:hypothetical protein [Micrococcoides hystricis]|uniref:Uncharacterized protein n=1 Tax=Micrococcoides hystricis TaxID=1572761 RepID=A0ABV6PA57_9MICC